MWSRGRASAAGTELRISTKRNLSVAPTAHVGCKMPTAVGSAPIGDKIAKIAQTTGLRKNGKHWHEKKKPFRPNAGQTSYATRVKKQAQEAEVKKIETEMKAEKEEERQVYSEYAMA